MSTPPSLQLVRELPARVVAAEIAWRVARSGLRTASGVTPRPCSEEADGRFPIDPAHVPTADDLSGTVLEACVLEAEEAAAGRFQVLGFGSVDFGRPPRWNTDPTRQVSWPVARGVAAPPRPDEGDIKVPWEASRLHWLTAMARAGLYTGESAHARAACDLLDQWVAANPVGCGPNWANTMEVGIRSINLVWASEITDEALLRRRARQLLTAHGVWILGHLEYSPRLTSNHFLADLVGLLHIGAALRESRRWRLVLKLTGLWFEREVLVQFGEDGVAGEASTAYHRLCTELAVLGVAALRAGGAVVGEATMERVAAAGDALAVLTQPNGSLPAVGDDDGSLAVGLQSGRHPLDPRPIVDGCAALLGDPQAGSGSEFGRWIAAAAPRDTRFSVPPTDGGKASTLLPDSGFAVLRSTRLWCLVDAGGVGQRGNGGHAHNDTLSFTLSVDGIEIVIDPGTGSYTGDTGLRNMLRGTASHATVQLDGEEINPIDDRLFALRGEDQPVIEAFVSGPMTSLVASHRGYTRLLHPVVHRRSFSLDDTRLTITDELQGAGRHRVTTRFPLGPAVEPERADSGWHLRAAGVTVDITLAAGPAIETAIEGGVVAPRYGEVGSNSVLTADAKVSLPCRFVWHLEPA